ncbi:TPA: alkene reductase [Photobacterium damselae]
MSLQMLTPIELAPNLTLKNRIVMAPMTRSMADDDLNPTIAMAEYYAKRAETGLIVTEATIVSPLGQGYPNTPGLYNESQIQHWQQVTDRVHQQGGKIFVQLWHCGRIAHSIYLNGDKPIAPSAVSFVGRVPRTDGLQYEEPRAMTDMEIERVIQEFAQAAANAKLAGFDGVEIHGANGYLIDQFLHWETNQRTDQWGGTPENMGRFLFRVIEAVQKEIDHVGLRLSPVGYLHMALNEKDREVSDYVLKKLNDYDLVYLHNGAFDDVKYDYIDGTVTQYMRRHYQGKVVGNGSYTPDIAEQVLEQKDADLVAIGRPLIANPDYVEKLKNHQPLTEYNAEMLNTLE